MVPHILRCKDSKTFAYMQIFVHFYLHISFFFVVSLQQIFSKYVIKTVQKCTQ